MKRIILSFSNAVDLKTADNILSLAFGVVHPVPIIDGHSVGLSIEVENISEAQLNDFNSSIALLNAQIDEHSPTFVVETRELANI